MEKQLDFEAERTSAQMLPGHGIQEREKLGAGTSACGEWETPGCVRLVPEHEGEDRMDAVLRPG